MKILLVNKFYSPTIGGVESVVRQHAQFLGDEGHQITVLCCSDRRSMRTRFEEQDGVRVIRCASFGTYFSMPISPVFIVWLWILSFKSKLVFFHLPFPIATLSALTLPFRRPFIVFWHSDIVQQKRLKPIVQFFQHCLCRRAESILTTSPQLVEFSDVISSYKEKLKVVPLSVPDSAPLAPEKKPSTLPLMPESYGLFLGRLCYYKGVDVILEALDLLANKGVSLPVVLVGDGPLKGTIAQALKEKRLNHVVYIDRHVDEDEKNWLLMNASYLLFPSTEPSEAFGIIQLEAMSYGVPVINTDLPTGVPWVSEHENTGLTVPVRDPYSLAKAMERLAGDETERKVMGQRALQRVSDMFSDSTVSRLLIDQVSRFR